MLSRRTSNDPNTLTGTPSHDQGGNPTRQGPSTHHVDHQALTSPPLTHARLTKHDQYYTHAYTTNGTSQQAGYHTASMIQAAAHTAKVTAAGRSLGFDLSEPVYGEAMRRYDGMTPGQRFLAEEDRARYVRAAAGQYTNGCHRK